MTTVTGSRAWQALNKHAESVRGLHLRDLFAHDPKRFERFNLRHDDLLLDYSKNRMTEETMRLLADLARAADVEGWRDKDVRRRKDQLHRGPCRPPRRACATDRPARPSSTARTSCRASPLFWKRCGCSRERVRERRVARRDRTRPSPTSSISASAAPTSGPLMVCEALKPYQRPDLRPHFVSNVDGAHLAHTLARLDPARTLFIVASKTFTTQETMTNAAQRPRLADDRARGGRASPSTSSPSRPTLPRWRGSGSIRRTCSSSGTGSAGAIQLWSAIGLPIALAVGFERFVELLEGAHAMDEHFRTAPLEQQPARDPGRSSASGTAISSGAARSAPSLRPASPSLPRLFPAGRHGEQRQVRAPRRQRASTTPPGRSSGASQAPTASTPSSSSSTRARSWSRATSSPRPRRQPPGRPSREAAGEFSGADGSPRLRQDRRRGAGGTGEAGLPGTRSRPSCPTRCSRETGRRRRSSTRS